ncbi:homoserine O-acetyltransferase [Geodermatophilus dictyosporus]|uniref:Homoserine O-acetyltransferase n=1 Tax=Geodermatophilus dictyosporus TaxID=1523247 RepID=A0A1I5TTW5_9ACTN|nr:alpha/beta fold hydrolase [Geodermatophilus dictyosporus]SFP86489.1 homoserine O-acetyltransferase [Geodermatophilus dictyosporus]
MIENAFYTPEVQGAYQLHSLGGFDLEEGGRIPDLRLAYATYGELNAAKDNAILVPTWFSGTHATWEQVYIGPGRALDPTRWFIVVVNQIGNGLSTSPHNTDGGIAMSRFPQVRIGDDVRAQQQLAAELFGIERWALVVGGSMGAQQTYEWAVRFPEQVLRAAPIAGTAQNTPHDFLFTRTLMDAITSDPGWNGGEYRSHTEVADGLRRHADIWAVLGLSTEFWRTGFWRGVELPDVTWSTFEEFQERFVQATFLAMDPNALLTMGWKWQRGDVTRHTDGDLAAALGRITARTFVMPIDEDMFFPPRDCAVEQALIKDSELRVLPSIAGHFGLFGFEPAYLAEVDRNLGELLDTEV